MFPNKKKERSKPVNAKKNKKHFYCEILHYKEFKAALPHKIDNRHFENYKNSNHFRNGVREISERTYNLILKTAEIGDFTFPLFDISGDFVSEVVEGKKKK